MVSSDARIELIGEVIARDDVASLIAQHEAARGSSRKSSAAAS